MTNQVDVETVVVDADYPSSVYHISYRLKDWQSEFFIRLYFQNGSNKSAAMDQVFRMAMKATDSGFLNGRQLEVVQQMLQSDAGLNNDLVSALLKLVDREGYRQEGRLTKDDKLDAILAKLDELVELIKKGE